MGATYLRYQTSFGLAERWAVAELAQTVTTYPNLDEARRFSMHLIRSRQHDVERRTRRVRGAGRSFDSLRDYLDGDEIRDVCWTASGRRGSLVTRLWEIERNQTIWVLIDAGRLMRARTSGLAKLDHAVNAALAVCQIALHSGDSVGVLAYGRKVTAGVSPGRGQAHLRRVVEVLAAVREEEIEADHLLAAGRLLKDQKRRSLVIWITDLAETAMTPEVIRAATHVMSRHVVVLAAVGDPDLQALATRMPDSVEQMFQGAAAQEIAQRRELLLARLRERGVVALETTAEGLSLALVNTYLDVKQRGRL